MVPWPRPSPHAEPHLIGSSVSAQLVDTSDRQTHRHGTSVTIGRIFAAVHAMWPDDIADLTCAVFPANLNPVVNRCARAPPNARSLHVSLGDMRRRPRVKSHSPSTCCLQCQTARKHDTHTYSLYLETTPLPMRHSVRQGTAIVSVFTQYFQ